MENIFTKQGLVLRRFLEETAEKLLFVFLKTFCGFPNAHDASKEII